MDTGIAFAAVTTRNEGVKVTGKLGFSSHPMIEHFKFLKAHTTRTPKMTIPAPSALYGRPNPTPIDKSIYPNTRQILRRPRPGLQEGGARLRRCRLPLSAARRSIHRHAVRSEISPADEGPRRRPGCARPALRRAHQHRDLRHPARHDGDHASVPRQLQIDLHGQRRLRGGAGSAVRQDQGARLFHGIRHRARRRLRAAAAPAEGPRRGARPGDDQDRRARNARTRSSAASRKRRNSPISTSSACRRNAASPRPRKAISSPRRSSGRNCA